MKTACSVKTSFHRNRCFKSCSAAVYRGRPDGERLTKFYWSRLVTSKGLVVFSDALLNWYQSRAGFDPGEAPAASSSRTLPRGVARGQGAESAQGTRWNRPEPSLAPRRSGRGATVSARCVRPLDWGRPNPGTPNRGGSGPEGRNVARRHTAGARTGKG